jgi:hypothetical protein
VHLHSHARKILRQGNFFGARRSAARGERLDLLRGADELKHHHGTKEHERDVKDAKAAPKTSAPMRMAALTTVSTWIQTILRSLLRLLMATGPGGGGNFPETAHSIKAYFLRFLDFLESAAT